VGVKQDITQSVSSGQHLWLGNHYERFYSFVFDELRIYNCVLSEDEIEALYYAGQAGKK
jgi:hypothetical protein